MSTKTPWWIRVPVLFFLIFGLMEFFIDSGDKPAIIEYPITQFFLLLVLMILIAIELILASIENIMFQTLSEEGKERYLEAKTKKYEWTWVQNLMKKLTRTKAIEKEEEIILDHNYDGIRELDNVLPPWWVYLFYVTIIFGVIYLVRFHVIGEYDQALEYEQEVAAAKIEIEEYKRTAKDLVDVNTVELLTDASDLSAGESIFQSNCVACHMADGGGGIGPNLTDAYWINGGGIKNVFNTISEGGRPGKGMIAWKQSLKPAEMAQVASYVITLGGTTPANPKEAEGDLWKDPDAPQTNESESEAQPEQMEQATDSTQVAMD
ncbi:cbb3-type cytochrome c oxidase N-terminal domain-containing protein [Flagellimonas zhangzhouensis]|uniref:Cytochrome c oxidase cbb3-type subunit 3 n=1 Tax=Flagellimonas zhangzhouensis TaxID=1073328 RepID=A0A1H2WSB1_9FLAO|nr:cbb3-type cytochrome c oxidase N-terminal domain-containing protein [Allomuricauda zhangzhouensis]SDQ24312.1 cytochrome c oxidase cbb3-type subunit 3 [Allomuricauda zhangzhouensis]SDW83530.1 cytochrome c oxidase cbb3-type subunit 3 [Allomuricauda zhangzhouensis]